MAQGQPVGTRPPVPNSGGKILAGDKDKRAIGAEANSFDQPFGAERRGQFGACLGIFNVNLSIPRGDSHELAIRAELAIGRFVTVGPKLKKLWTLLDNRRDAGAVQKIPLGAITP